MGAENGPTNMCAEINSQYSYFTCEVNSLNITFYDCASDSKCNNCNATSFPINNLCEGVFFYIILFYLFVILLFILLILFYFYFRFYFILFVNKLFFREVY